MEEEEKERTIGTITDENVTTPNLMQEFLVARAGVEQPHLELEQDRIQEMMK
jgi:hypothetical protein